MHEVGQIIFLVSRKTQSILAAQICEQNVKKTLDGEETTFRVRIGGNFDTPDDLKLYDLDRVDADIYGSPEEAAESLYAAAKSAIDELVNAAVEDAASCFDYQRLPEKKSKASSRPRTKKATTSTRKSKTATKPAKEETPVAYVTMPDGTQARLKTPLDTVTGV